MRWIIAVVIAVYGLMTIDLESLRWGTAGVVLFSLPLLLQWPNHKGLQIWALWGGLFLVVQSLLTPVVIDHDFKTLPPNMKQIVDVKGGIPGVNGQQLITTDGKGFRTTKKIDYENDDSFRIFAIGGSATEQIYLDDRTTWTHLLQERLSKTIQQNVEVINTGVAGLRSKQHLSTLRHILGLHPNLVLFLVGVNDWNFHIKKYFAKDSPGEQRNDYRNNLLLKNSLLGNFILTVDQSLKNKDNNINQQVPIIRIDHGEYYSVQRGSLGRSTVFSFYPKDVDPEYAANLSKLSNLCHKDNIDCLFITQPTGYQVAASEQFKKGFWMTPPNQIYTLDFESMVHVASLYNNYLVGTEKSHNQ